MLVHLWDGADLHRARRGRFRFGDQSDGPLAVQRHDLFDAVPVGFCQGEAAGSGSRVVAHHAESGLGGVAVGFGRYPVLSGIQQPPVITTYS